MRYLQQSAFYAASFTTLVAALICFSLPHCALVAILGSMVSWFPYFILRRNRSGGAFTNVVFCLLYLIVCMIILCWIFYSNIFTPTKTIRIMPIVWASIMFWQGYRALMMRISISNSFVRVARSALSAAVFSILITNVFGATLADELLIAISAFVLFFGFLAISEMLELQPIIKKYTPNFVSDMNYRYLPGNIFNQNNHL